MKVVENHLSNGTCLTLWNNSLQFFSLLIQRDKSSFEWDDFTSFISKDQSQYEHNGKVAELNSIQFLQLAEFSLCLT